MVPEFNSGTKIDCILFLVFPFSFDLRNRLDNLLLSVWLQLQRVRFSYTFNSRLVYQQCVPMFYDSWCYWLVQLFQLLTHLRLHYCDSVPLSSIGADRFCVCRASLGDFLKMASRSFQALGFSQKVRRALEKPRDCTTKVRKNTSHNSTHLVCGQRYTDSILQEVFAIYGIYLPSQSQLQRKGGALNTAKITCLLQQWCYECVAIFIVPV